MLCCVYRMLASRRWLEDEQCCPVGIEIYLNHVTPTGNQPLDSPLCHSHSHGLHIPAAASMQQALRHIRTPGVAAPSAVSVVSLKLSVSWSPSLISCFVRACKLTSCWITAFTYHTCQHTAHNRQLLTHVFPFFYLPLAGLHYAYMLREIKGCCSVTFPLFVSSVPTNK